MEARKSLGDWQFLDFELSSNAQRMLVRTLRNGQVDVGIYDLKRNRLNPVTKDAFDETEAHFLPDNRILYLTDRYIDSLPAPAAPFTSAFIYYIYNSVHVLQFKWYLWRPPPCFN
jgi:hypothetical protein